MPTIDGSPVVWFLSKHFLGVIAPRSDGSTLKGVSGGALSAYSTRPKAVFKTSSMRLRVPRMAYTTLWKLWNKFTQMPLYSSVLGKVNLHLMSFCASSAAMLSMFNFSINSRSSFSAPIKFVLLTDQIVLGVTRLEMHHCNSSAQLVSMDGST